MPCRSRPARERTAARVAARYHAQRPWFPDAVPWLEDVRRRYRLCLASDADEAMVGEHVRQYPFDRCFTSERLQVYKGDAQNRFFEAIVRHYAMAPGQMLHVGDSPGEIVAAQRLGLQTCWVKRSGRSWPHEHPPAYEVASLDTLVSLLEDAACELVECLELPNPTGGSLVDLHLFYRESRLGG